MSARIFAVVLAFTSAKPSDAKRISYLAGQNTDLPSCECYNLRNGVTTSNVGEEVCARSFTSGYVVRTWCQAPPAGKHLVPSVSNGCDSGMFRCVMKFGIPEFPTCACTDYAEGAKAAADSEQPLCQKNEGGACYKRVQKDTQRWKEIGGREYYGCPLDMHRCQPPGRDLLLSFTLTEESCTPGVSAPEPGFSPAQFFPPTDVANVGRKYLNAAYGFNWFPGIPPFLPPATYVPGTNLATDVLSVGQGFVLKSPYRLASGAYYYQGVTNYENLYVNGVLQVENCQPAGELSVPFNVAFDPDCSGDADGSDDQKWIFTPSARNSDTSQGPVLVEVGEGGDVFGWCPGFPEGKPQNCPGHLGWISAPECAAGYINSTSFPGPPLGFTGLDGNCNGKRSIVTAKIEYATPANTPSCPQRDDPTWPKKADGSANYPDGFPPDVPQEVLVSFVLTESLCSPPVTPVPKIGDPGWTPFDTGKAYLNANYGFCYVSPFPPGTPGPQSNCYVGEDVNLETSTLAVAQAFVFRAVRRLPNGAYYYEAGANFENLYVDGELKVNNCLPFTPGPQGGFYLAYDADCSGDGSSTPKWIFSISPTISDETSGAVFGYCPVDDTASCVDVFSAKCAAAYIESASFPSVPTGLSTFSAVCNGNRENVQVLIEPITSPEQKPTCPSQNHPVWPKELLPPLSPSRGSSVHPQPQQQVPRF